MTSHLHREIPSVPDGLSPGNNGALAPLTLFFTCVSCQRTSQKDSSHEKYTETAVNRALLICVDEDKSATHRSPC